MYKSTIAIFAIASQVSAYPALNLYNDAQGYSPSIGLLEAAADRARTAILAVPIAILEGNNFFNPLASTFKDDCDGRGANAALPDNCKICLDTTACVWEKITGVCMKKPPKPTPKHVDSIADCQKLYDESPEGKVEIAWKNMKPHVFGTEAGNNEPWSGRHTLRAFRAGKGNANFYGVCDATSDLCIFTKGQSAVKTVFGNSYTDADVERICKDAIRTNKSGKTSAWVVDGLGGRRICVQHQVEGSGSCYPLGVNVSTGNKGDACPAGTGNEPATSVDAP